MSGFAYFIESRAAINRAGLVELGLGYAFAGAPCAVRSTTSGPGDAPGVVVACEASDAGYFPGKQSWRRLRGPVNARIWIGQYDDREPPGPDWLRTPEQLPGHLVTLRDGRQWLVPCARQFADGEQRRAVPARLDIDGDGRWISGDVLPEYSRLWHAAERFAEWFLAGDQAGALLIGDLTDYAVAALSVHYRLGPVEAAMLGLFDDRGLAAREVMLAAIDWPTMQAWAESQKKATADQASAA